MHWFGDFDLHKRYTVAPVLTRIPVFVCVGVFLFLCLFSSSALHASCLNKISTDSQISPLLYSDDIWKSKEVTKVIHDKHGTPVAWNALGALHLYRWNVDGKKKDIEKAKECFEKASEKNHPPALNNLGIIYLNGWGVEKNINEAERYFKRAIGEKGKEYIPALNNFGIIKRRRALEDPRVFDTSEGSEEIKQAAKAGYLPAWNNLGVIHLRNEEYKDAVEKFEYAAKFNYVPALFNLGTFYARGYGGHRDYKEAAELYNKAAQKNVDAQYTIGLMYSKGIGVKQDLTKSFFWLDIAQKNGSIEAEKVQSVVKESLTEKELSEAISKVKKYSQEIHTMDPSTLYDDVATAPELYEGEQLYKVYERKRSNWVSTYFNTMKK